MAQQYRLEIARVDEIPDLAALIVRSFAHFEIETLLGNRDDPEALQAAGGRHLRAWHEHKAESGEASGLKCMGKDPMNGEEVLVACAYWYFFSKPRSSEQMHRENYLLSADWIPEEGGQRKQVKRHLQPVLDTRLKWNTGRGHAILMYMATEKQWRRKGAATVVVQWGLDRCRERNIPAFLEASEDGAPVYARLGFEKVDDIVVDIDGDKSVSPVMMWWPPGTKDEDKRPLTE